MVSDSLSADDPPPPEDRTARAAAWLSALDLGVADREAFEIWRAADPLNAVAFAKVAALWSDLSAVRMARPAAEESIAPPIPSTPPRQAAPSRRGFLRAAGIGTAVVGAGGLAAGRVLAREHLKTAVGQRRETVLPGGARLILNTDSRVSWRFSSGRGKLWLERGEIALILPASAAPCVLHADKATAELTAGGQFNARLRDGLLDLTVLHGEASGSGGNGGPARIAVAAQRLLLAPSGPVTRTATAGELEAVRAWREGEVVFEDQALGAAIEEYNRYLTRRIVIVDPDIAGIRVGGRFVSSDPRDFLTALSASLGVRATTVEDKVLLTRGK